MDDRIEQSDLLAAMQEAAQQPGLALENPPLNEQQTLREALYEDMEKVKAETPVPEATPAPVVEPPAEPQAPAPAVEPATPVEPAATEVAPEPETTPEYEIPPEDLEKYYTMGKLYGEEKKYTLQDLLNTNQTQDAASKQLEDYKALVRDFAQNQQRPAEPIQEVPEPEYMTDEERAFAKMESKIDHLESSLKQNETSRMTEVENTHVVSSLAAAGLTQDDFGNRVNHLLTQNPRLAPYAQEVFTEQPDNRTSLDKRIGMFDLLLDSVKAMDNPNVVKTTREQAFNDGRVAAKVEAKRNLTNVDGVSQPSEPSRTDMINKATSLDNDGAWADLLLETGVFKDIK